MELINDLTMLEVLAWSQDPMRMCGDEPVILAESFEGLASDLSEFTITTDKTKEEIYDILIEQTKRFTACGGNFGLDEGLIKKYTKKGGGWNYIMELLKK